MTAHRCARTHGPTRGRLRAAGAPSEGTLELRKATRAEPPQQAICDALGLNSDPGGIRKTLLDDDRAAAPDLFGSRGRTLGEVTLPDIGEPLRRRVVRPGR